MSEQAQVIYLFVCVHCSAKLLVRFFICHSKHTQYEALGLDFFCGIERHMASCPYIGFVV
jgi:hypothetical protein